MNQKVLRNFLSTIFFLLCIIYFYPVNKSKAMDLSDTYEIHFGSNVVKTSMENEWKFVIKDGKIHGAMYVGAPVTTLVYPSSIDDYPVVSITTGMDYANKTNLENKLTKVVISEGIEAILGGAFSDYYLISEVSFPSTLVYIGYDAFRCSNVTNVKFPNSLRQINDQVFGESPNLTYIVLPASLSYIDGGPFNDCPKLTKAYIPNESIRSILGSYCFLNSPTEVVVGNPPAETVAPNTDITIEAQATEINVTIPLNVTCTINPNNTTTPFVAGAINILNNTPAPVKIGLLSFTNKTTGVTDVLPADKSWNILSTTDTEKFLALGLKGSTNWYIPIRSTDIYVKQVTGTTQLGVLDSNKGTKKSISLSLVANHGFAFKTAKTYKYQISWIVELYDGIN